MRTLLRLSVHILLFAMILLLSPRALAQDEIDDATDDSAAASPDDPQALETLPSIQEVELHVLPLRRDELAAEMETWIARVKARMIELADTRVTALQAEGEEKTQLQQRVVELSERKSALIDRAEVVLNAYKQKGGDAEEYEQYLVAVGGVDVNVADAGAVWIYLRNWLTSPQGGIAVALKIVKFVATLFAFWIASRIIGSIVKKGVDRLRKTSGLLRDFLINVTRKTVMIVGFVVALSMLGINIGPLVAAIGAAGLVIGLALQGTLSNFASGILILIYRPFDVGDAVEVAGKTGKVDFMTLVTTTIVSFDNQKIIIPNNEIWNNVITNITGRPTRRVDMVFGISYRNDIDKAKAVLGDIITSHQMVLADPAPNIQVSALADSSVNFIVRPWAKTADYWQVYWDVHAEVKRRFDKEGIGIPFPQMDVHFHRQKK
ncbi:MAG: mechanosensitive ion channel domain-containing protein [Phycisphaerales bacterium]